MPIFNYKTDIIDQKLANEMILSLQRFIADFSISTIKVQNDYILTLMGNREVPEVALQFLEKQGISSSLIDITSNTSPEIPVIYDR